MPAGWAAAATVASGALQARSASRAAGRAADAAERSTALGIDEQRRQYDLTRADQQPFVDAGQAALSQQQDLLGLSGEAPQQAAFDAFNNSPGQQFLRGRGEEALLRNSAAIGGLGGGNVRSELQRQGIGFAQQDLQNQLSRLAGMAGQGQGAVTNLGGLGANMATNISGQLNTQGANNANSILAQQQAQSQFTQQAGNTLAGGVYGMREGGGGFGQGAAAGASSNISRF